MPTTGTPNHVSVLWVLRGNPTTVTYATQGSSTLTKTLTYFDTGNVDVATDVNGAQAAPTPTTVSIIRFRPRG